MNDALIKNNYFPKISILVGMKNRMDVQVMECSVREAVPGVAVRVRAVTRPARTEATGTMASS